MLMLTTTILLCAFITLTVHAVDGRSHPQQQPLPQRACSAPPHDQYLFCDPTLPLDERLDDLISRLTLEEKPWLLTARVSPYGNLSRLGIPEYNWGANCVHGVQSKCIPPPPPGSQDDGKITTGNNNSTNNNSSRCATSFPNPNTLGSSFNKTSWKEMGRVMGIELRSLWLLGITEYSIHAPHAQYTHLGLDCWSPNINIVRDPRWGRNMESPSEDPFVAGVFGTQITLGLQGNITTSEEGQQHIRTTTTTTAAAAAANTRRIHDSRYLQAVSTIKHFTANSIEGQWWTEDGRWVPHKGNISRHNVNTVVSLYDMTTSYLPAFKRAVQQGGAAGVMCSFNRINGVPSCVNEYLLKRTLRGGTEEEGDDEGWKFRGYVTSDTNGINDIRDNHRYTYDWDTTVGLAIEAGCDVESGGTGPSATTDSLYIEYLPSAVRAGIVSEDSIDQALRNALSIRFRLGLFDPVDDQPFWNIPKDTVRSPNHIQSSKEATAQGIVLLKNDHNLIPIDNQKKVALIGPHIHDRTTMVGNYIGEICYNDTTNGCVTSFVEGFTNVTSVDLIRSSVGCSISGNNKSAFLEAMEVASQSEIVVFIGGLDLKLEEEDWDRPDIRLPQIQADLIEALSEVNSNIILVLLHGGIVGLDRILDKVSSVVSVGYPGPFGGEVIPKVLYGLESRAWGKSTITWYKDSIVDKFNMMDFDMGRTPGRTYRYYIGEPHFKFGHGLNPLMTSDLGHISTLSTNKCPCREVEVSVSVSNYGTRDGDEVMLAYFEPQEIPHSQPASKIRRQLFEFDRIHLPVGSSINVTFVVTAKSLELADDAGRAVTFPGLYNLILSNGQDEKTQLVMVDQNGNIRLVEESFQSSNS